MTVLNCFLFTLQGISGWNLNFFMLISVLSIFKTVARVIILKHSSDHRSSLFNMLHGINIPLGVQAKFWQQPICPHDLWKHPSQPPITILSSSSVLLFASVTIASSFFRKNGCLGAFACLVFSSKVFSWLLASPFLRLFSGITFSIRLSALPPV